MPVPGYDPIDIDHMLESRLGDADIQAHLDTDDMERYRAGEATLFDLLDDDQIQEILDLSGETNTVK